MGVLIRDGRLRPGWRVTFYLLIYLLGMLAAQSLVLGGYSAALLFRGQTTLPELTERLRALDLPLWLFAAIKAADTLWALLLTWLFARYVDKRRLAQYGLRLSSGWLDDVLLGLALGAIQMAAIVGIAWIGGWVQIAPLPDVLVALRIRDAALGLVLFTLVAVGEELVFRGYVQTTLCPPSVPSRPKAVGDPPTGGKKAGAVAGLQTVPPAVALGVSSLIFALFHALNPNLTWLAMLNLALAGAALGVGYWATGSLLLPLAYHLSWNFVQGSILGLPVSGMRYGGLLIVADWGKAAWLTGHTFGPEGGLIGTLVLLTAFPVFWVRRRKAARLED